MAVCISFEPVCLAHVAQMPVDIPTQVAVALTAFAIYAADKVSGSREDLLNSPNRAWLAKYPIKAISAISYCTAIIIIALSDISKLIYILVPGIAGAIYTIRIGKFRPKDVPGVKTIIVATSTALCYGGLLSGPLWLYGLAWSVNVIDTTLSDIRDIVGDRIAGVHTLPVVLGGPKTLGILTGLDMAIAYLSPQIAIYGLFLIIYFRKERYSLSYDLFVDGWLMWVYLALLILERT